MSNKLVIHNTWDMYLFMVQQLLEENPNLKTRTNKRGRDTVCDKETNEVLFSYKQFKEIQVEYNKQCGQALIHGYCIDLLNGLGYVEPLVIERSPYSKRINQGATSKLKKKLKAENRWDGKNHIVYYTDEEYISLYWKKNYPIRNAEVYKFKPTRGKVGLANLLSDANQARPELRGRYRRISRK